MRAVAALVVAGLRGRRRGGVSVTLGMLLLAAVGLCSGFVVADQGAAQLSGQAARIGDA